MAIEFAARYPDPVGSLILVHCFARFVRGDGYPFGIDLATADALVDDSVETRPTETNIDTLALLHRRSCLGVDIGHSRYLLEHLPRARLEVLTGTDSLWFTDAPDLVEHARRFIAKPAIRTPAKKFSLNSSSSGVEVAIRAVAGRQGGQI